MFDHSKHRAAGPNWVLDQKISGSPYEVEIDINSQPLRYRHRLRTLRDEVDWTLGKPPN